MIPSIDDVTSLIRAVTLEVILPRFRNLAEGDISQKKGGELVTIADHESEARLASGLAALAPGSAVVGEEAAEVDARVFRALAGEAPVWLIDPVDGTRNFASGSACFAVIIAYCRGGDVRAGWIHDPVENITVVAEEGSGAWLGGQRLHIDRDVPIGSMSGSLSGRLKERVEARRAGGDLEMPANVVRWRCAGQQYMGLARGGLHFSRYGQLKPWDHAAGVLIHREAGGFSAHMKDEAPYRPEPGIVPGPFLLAPSRSAWRRLHRLLNAV